MFSDAIQVRVCLLLNRSKSSAWPSLVDDASGLRATPGAASISLPIKLQALGIVPNAEGLDGKEVVALCLCEAQCGLVVDDLVDRLKVLHRSPVARKEVGMAGSGDGAVVYVDLLEWNIQEMEAEGWPCVDNQASSDSSLVLGKAGAEEANRTSHRPSLAGPQGPSPIGWRRAGRWLHLKGSSANAHDALL